MQLLFTPLFKQLAHDDGAFDAFGSAVAVNDSGLVCADFKADLSCFVSHVLLGIKSATRRTAQQTTAEQDCIGVTGEERRTHGLAGISGGGKHLCGLRVFAFAFWQDAFFCPQSAASDGLDLELAKLRDCFAPVGYAGLAYAQSLCNRYLRSKEFNGFTCFHSLDDSTSYMDVGNV